MRVTILGSGGAAGVPAVGSGWGACDPLEPRNNRRRPSILVEEGNTRLLVDTSPDLRAQLLDAGVNKVDAVLYTHEHADHLHGIDDLREVNRAMKAALPIWASEGVLATIRERFGYVLEPLSPDASSIYKPLLLPNAIEGPFAVGPITVIPFDQDHGYGRSLGFRFGPVAYSTDAVQLPEAAFAAMKGVQLLVVGCLVDYPHPTHADLDKAVGWIERIAPKQAVLTHMGPRLDYQSLCARLPDYIRPGYDGMVIEIPPEA